MPIHSAGSKRWNEPLCVTAYTRTHPILDTLCLNNVPLMALANETIRVLLVEDDAMSRELWSLLLEGEGYHVHAVDSGEAALIALQHPWSPAVVLMDMQLPGLAGAPLAAAIRKVCPPRSSNPNHAAAGLVILAMSGSEPRETESLAGFDGFLLKPFTIDVLECQINATLTATLNATPVPAISAPHAGQMECGDSVALMLDPTIYRRLAASMPSGILAGLYALCLRDARVRLESMHQAALASDELAYQRQAHAIKGGCGMVGAAALAVLADHMEIDGLTVGIDQVIARTRAFEVACDRLEGMLKDSKLLLRMAEDD